MKRVETGITAQGKVVHNNGPFSRFLRWHTQSKKKRIVEKYRKRYYAWCDEVFCRDGSRQRALMESIVKDLHKTVEARMA